MLLIACIALLAIGSAQAVHDQGVYQLDGNAQVTDNTELPVMPTASEDADSICAGQIAIQGTTSGNDRGQFCHKATGVTLPAATSSTRFAFVTDGSGPFASVQGNTDDQYTGGSGDAQDISAWAYKNAASSNDKSDIQNAFAAQYTVSSCPSDSTHAGCHVGDKVIYFGGDRTSDSGDENTAFWFLQNPAAESPNGACTAPSGCPFTTDGSAWNGIAAGTAGSNLATHKAAFPGADRCLFNPAHPAQSLDFNTGGFCSETQAHAAAEGDSYGDILVVSAFTGGGVQPNVTAYEWIGSEPYGTAKNADKSACGTSSCTTIKILSVSSGCNTTDSGDAACAITNQAVQSGIVGENPQPIQAPWVYSEKVGDNGQSGANTCTTVANKMCPSIFLEAGLNLSALGLQSECTSTFVMDTRSSQSVSSSLQDLTVGQVGACSASLTTKAGDTTDTPENGGTPVASPNSIGTGSVSSGTDTAAITVSGASSYSGTITWFICGPFASEPAAPKCDTTHGVPAGSASVSETDNNTHYFLSSSANLTSKGVYCWTAHFEPASGQNSQITAKDDNGANECFTVNPVTPTLTTCSGTYTGAGTPAACVPATSVSFGSAIHDRARLSNLATEPATNGGRTSSPSGTVNPCTVAAPCFPTINASGGAYAGIITFTLNGPTAAGATGCGSQTNNSTTAGDTNPQSTPATGSGSVASIGNGVYGPVSYTPGGANGAGVYHWQATLANSGSTNNSLPVSEGNANCTDTNEDVTVQQIPTSISTQQSWYPNDTAQISASTGNLGDSGTVDFYLYSGTDCSGSVLYSERVTLGTSLSGPQTVSTHNYAGNSSVPAKKPDGTAAGDFPVTTLPADAAGSTKPATAGQKYFWKVIYTVASADTGHTGRQSNCLESHNYTYTNDNSGGTVSP